MVWAMRHLGSYESCKIIHLIYNCTEHINVISDDLLRALDGLSDSLLLDIRIHITASVQNSESDAEKSEGSVSFSDTGKLHDAPHVRILHGRPDVRAIIESEIAEASGSMSVNGEQISVEYYPLLT